MKGSSICLVITLIVFVLSMVAITPNVHANNVNAQIIHAKEMVQEEVGLKECMDKWRELHVESVRRGHTTPIQATQFRKQLYQVASQNNICVAWWTEAFPDEHGLFWPDAWSGECWGWTWREDRTAQEACEQALEVDYHLYLQWATQVNEQKTALEKMQIL